MNNNQKPLFGNFPNNTPAFEIANLFIRRAEVFKNVTVWPESGLLRKQNGELEIEPIWIKDHLMQCGDYASKWSYFPMRKYGLYFNISLFWWQNYYHWFADVLTRLHEMLPIVNTDLKIILPPKMTSWHMRSLELIGIPMNQCIHYVGKRPWKVEKLFYVSPIMMTLNNDVKTLTWVRETMLSKLPLPRHKVGHRKFYLTRKGGRSRHVINEDSYLPILKKYGVEVIDCSELSLEEQIRIFSEAKCIIGPHGAALTNMLFAPSGLQVFEFFEPETVRQCYWSMSLTLGHQYYCGVGTSIENPGGEAHLSVTSDELLGSLAAAGII